MPIERTHIQCPHCNRYIPLEIYNQTKVTIDECLGPNLCTLLSNPSSRCPDCPYAEEYDKKIERILQKVPEDFDPEPDKR